MSIALWIVQALLAALFLFAGSFKVFGPADMLTELVPLPLLLIRFVGLAECLGAFGLILPGLLKIRPRLTVLAALELIHIMVGATIITLVTQDAVSALLPLAVGCLAAFVAYGRSRLAPQSERAPRRRLAPFAA